MVQSRSHREISIPVAVEPASTRSTKLMAIDITSRITMCLSHRV